MTIFTGFYLCTSNFYVHFWTAKNEPKSCPLQAAYLLSLIAEAGRKVFSLIPFSATRLRRSLTKGGCYLDRSGELRSKRVPLGGSGEISNSHGIDVTPYGAVL